MILYLNFIKKFDYFLLLNFCFDYMILLYIIYDFFFFLEIKCLIENIYSNFDFIDKKLEFILFVI